MQRRSSARRGDPVRPGTPGPRLAREFVDELGSVSRGIRDPAAKLRFLRHSVDRYQDVQRAVAAVPSSFLRRLVLRLFGLERLRRLVAAWESRADGGRQLTGAIATTLVLVMLGLVGVGVARSLRGPVAAAPTAAIVARTPEAAAPRPPAAETLPPASAAAPAQVWQVEAGPDFELFSNGLRVELAYATTHVPRRFRVFSRAQGRGSEQHERPVGLLYHTSESDIWPLEAAYNENLRESSHNLMRYIRRLHLYNYVIDRFGRVFRVVAEEHKANHAGNSVWASGEAVYLNLNNAFLGVSFESRWEGGHVLPITQAQLNAGRLLTEYLRQRWQIAPEMCVTHGLASVNPRKHLIGHHVDWARGFPFEAFGLPDQYTVASPAVALFGFGYDDDFVKIMGAPWAGVREAETHLVEQAALRGIALEDLRRERQALYDTWLAAQNHDDEQAAASDGRAVRTAGAAAAAVRRGNRRLSASGG